MSRDKPTVKLRAEFDRLKAEIDALLDKLEIKLTRRETDAKV